MSRSNVNGQVFGRLTVIANADDRWSSTRPFRFVKVACSCGAETEVRLTSLRNGRTTSCGCFRKEATGNMSRSHGQAGTRLYRIWKGMLTRCNTPSASNYSYYGGRGITVCPEWQTFEPFQQWAMTHGYQEDLTIDREKGDQNYTPSNCRWATLSEQAYNRNYRR